MRFGISTYLFHDVPLAREHLVAIGAHGFEAIELFAVRSHFDYRDDDAVARLATWLLDTGVSLHSLHAPIATSFAGGSWGTPLSIASSDPAQRRAAVDETIAAVQVAHRLPFSVLVLHLGVPRELEIPVGGNQLDAARRSVEEIHAVASPLEVRLAIEIIPNELSAAETLVSFVEDDLDLADVGVCLDYGHAFLMGDLVDAIEAVAGHLFTTHVHDNRGRDDEHLLPFEGGIDWGAALMATQKVGFDGTLLFELGGGEEPGTILRRTRHVRRRFEELMI